MPTAIQYLCGSPSSPLADGQQYQPRLGRMGDTIVSHYRGKYGEANSRGQLYHFSTLVAGVTLPIFTNTAHVYGLRNPAGSGVVLELARLELGYLSGTQAPGNLVFCQAPNPNDTIATASGGIEVATQTAGRSGQYGGNAPASKCRMLTAITTVAPTVILRTLGVSQYTMPATNATQGETFTGYVFDGSDLLYPGQILLLATTVAAGAGVNVINMVALEIPTPNGG